MVGAVLSGSAGVPGSVTGSDFTLPLLGAGGVELGCAAEGVVGDAEWQAARKTTASDRELSMYASAQRVSAHRLCHVRQSGRNENGGSLCANWLSLGSSVNALLDPKNPDLDARQVLCQMVGKVIAARNAPELPLAAAHKALQEALSVPKESEVFFVIDAVTSSEVRGATLVVHAEDHPNIESFAKKVADSVVRLLAFKGFAGVPVSVELQPPPSR